jgi:gamma-glutamyl-gamma-aminobutyrate hydrolase PuuD
MQPSHLAIGLAEGLELPGHPFGLAVQWHPEWMPEHDLMQAIFRAFVTAAGERSS